MYGFWEFEFKNNGKNEDLFYDSKCLKKELLSSEDMKAIGCEKDKVYKIKTDGFQYWVKTENWWELKIDKSFIK